MVSKTYGKRMYDKRMYQTKTKYKRIMRRTKKLTNKYRKKLTGGDQNIIEDNIIRSIISRSALDYNLSTGELLKAYSENNTPLSPHFKRKLQFLKKFFKDDGKFTEIPDLMVELKNKNSIINTITDASDITYANILIIKQFLKDHGEYISDYDGFAEINEKINKKIVDNSTPIPTDQVIIYNNLVILKKAIEDNAFTYYFKKFAKDMNYKFKSDIRNVDEAFAEMIYEFNSKYNETYKDEKLKPRKIGPVHKEETSVKIKEIV